MRNGFLPGATGRRGPCRTRTYTTEALPLDAGKLKGFFKSRAPSTVVEFPGMRRSIDLSRVADDRIYVARCPPPIEEQEIELIKAPWGPDSSFWRYFFRCPWCSRRVLKLFVPHGGSGWGCRSCHRITYRPKRDQLDVLLARHAEIASTIGRLVKLRALVKDHVVAPSTSEEIAQHVKMLLGQVEALGKKVEMHTGVPRRSRGRMHAGQEGG